MSQSYIDIYEYVLFFNKSCYISWKPDHLCQEFAILASLVYVKAHKPNINLLRLQNTSAMTEQENPV